MSNLEENLKKAGLTGNEARIYLELLQRGSINGSQLANKAGLDRTLTYQVLNNLIKKGLVNYIIKEHKKHFEASSPNNLLNPIKEKKAFIEDLIPELKNLEKAKDTINEVSVYEGKEGLRATYMLWLEEKDTFCAFGSTGRLYDVLYESPRIAKEIEKKGLKGRVVINPKYKGHKMMQYKNLHFKFLDVDSEATTTVFGEVVCIHLIKEKPIVIIIKNKYIAESYRNYFEFLWKAAKSY